MYRYLMMTIIGGVFSSALYAQNSETILPDFEYVSHSDPWLRSNNASGLSKFTLSNISYADVSFNKDNGKFINYYQSDDSYTLGGKAESYYRMSPKVVVYGRISYDSFNGKHMGGSAFINPYYNPFDIVAEADSTAGEKHLEKYHLIGAIGVNVYKGLNVGGKIDYLTANYAKYKDLRHKNSLTDLSLTLGASYTLNHFLEIGINYFYRRTIESIGFDIYGNEDRMYYSLIDFGTFFGRREIFGDTGYTNSRETKPMYNKFHGGSAQVDISISDKIKLFNELTYKYRDGYYGINSSAAILYTKHNASIYEYRGVVTLSTKRDLHTLQLFTGREKLENNENIYEINTIDGRKTITYHGSTRVLDQDRISAKLGYTANLNTSNNYPEWVLKANLNIYQQKKTTSLYPYYRKQTINITDIDVSANRNIFAKQGQIYKLLLGTRFTKGSGTDKNDGMYTSQSGGSTPVMLDSDLYKEYEYLTSPQLQFKAGFGYQRPVNAEVAVYGNIQYQYTKAFDIKYLSGSTFGSLAVTIGCNF